MAKAHQFRNIQRIPATIEEVWQFFSAPSNLALITPAFMKIEMKDKNPAVDIYAGLILEYRLRPLLRVPVRWVTEIVEVVPFEMFADTQQKGPFASWLHQHYFKPVEGGTEMTDIVNYQLPFGAAGNLFHPIVRKQLEELFKYRTERIEEMWNIEQTNR
jgi:ligand-binding SRPBCC domain-containing protein